VAGSGDPATTDPGSTAIQTGESPAASTPPTTRLPDAEDVRKALHKEPDLLGRLLAALSQRLPFELVLLIEQADDLFSLLKPGGNDHNLQGSLAMLRALLAVPARAKLVLSLRTEYLGRLFDAVAQGPEDGQHVRTFLTRELTQEQLVEIILQPTSAEPLPNTEEVPLDKYGFQFEEGLAETIAAEAVKFGGQNQESVLVLTHVVCTRLFQLSRQRAEKVIRAADLKSIGGVEKGLSKYVESTLKASTGRDRRALTMLFLELFIRQPDGSLTRDLLFQDDIKAKWLGTTPLEVLAPAVAAGGVRLLDVSWLNVGGKEGNYLSLGHDALAPVAAQQAEETTRRAYGWTKMGDVLWITVPLLILLGVFAWRQISALSSANEKMDDQAKQFKDMFKQIEKDSGDIAEVNRSMFWPAYLGQLRAAEQAYLAGDMVHMRQALLAAKPGSRSDEGVRGFEWYYLWGLMRQDRATLLGHEGPVTAVAVAPDGQTAASAGADGIVRLWDVTRGEQLFKIDITVDKVAVAINGLDFSPDGSMLAAAQDNKVVRVWRVKRLGFSQAVNLVLAPVSALLHDIGPLVNLTFLAANKLTEDSVKDRFELSDHTGPVLAVAFSPDSKTLAAACKDNIVNLWDLSGAQPAVRHTLKEHTGPVLALAWSKDGTWLATGGADNLVHIWEAKTGKKEKTLPKHSSAVAALAWSTDGKTLASGSSDKQGGYEGGIVKLFDTMSWTERSLPKLQVAAVSALAFSANGNRLIIAGKDNTIRLCDATSGEEMQVLKGHLGWVPSVAQSKDGKVLVSGSFDGKVKIWDPELLANRNLLKVSTAAVAAVLFAPDDRRLATGSGDGLVKLWDVATGKQLKELAGSHKGGVLALAWGAEGKTLISGGADGMLRLWDTDPNSATFGKELDSVAAHAKEVACLSSADKGKTLASGSSDGTVKIWGFDDTKFAKQTVDIKTEGGAVHCLALRDGGPLVTGHEDGKVRFWNPLTGKAAELKSATLSGHTARVTAVAFLIDPAYVLTASADRTIKIWNFVKGEEVGMRRGHAGPITGLVCSKDVHHIVTCAADHTVKVWDPALMRQENRITLIGHTGPVRAVALSADRRIIASAGQDGTVRLWRAVAPEGNLNLPLRITP
jgi:WD40 repeat protein